VPFSMWSINDLAAEQRQVIRIRLSMAPQTFESHIGRKGMFYAYGESILLNKIEYEDLACYKELDAGDYRQAFAKFKSGFHIVPDVFEYLVISPRDTYLGWEATPLSPMLSPQVVLPKDIQRNTRWFIADYKQSDKWSLVGSRYNGFVVKITAAA